LIDTIFNDANATVFAYRQTEFGSSIYLSLSYFLCFVLGKHLPFVLIDQQQRSIIHMKSMLKLLVIYFIVYHYYSIVQLFKSLLHFMKYIVTIVFHLLNNKKR
jgi:hypothetical protein